MNLVTRSTRRLGVLLSLSLAMVTGATSAMAMPFHSTESFILAPTAVEDSATKLESQASDIPLDKGDQVGLKTGEGSLLPAVQTLTPGAEGSAQVDMRKAGGDPKSAGGRNLEAGAAVDMFRKSGGDPGGSKNNAASLNFTKTDGESINFVHGDGTHGLLVPAVQDSATGGGGAGKVDLSQIHIIKQTDKSSPSFFNPALQGNGQGANSKLNGAAVDMFRKAGGEQQEFNASQFNNKLNNTFTGPVTAPGLTPGAANKGGTSPVHHTGGANLQIKNETLLHSTTPLLK